MRLLPLRRIQLEEDIEDGTQTTCHGETHDREPTAAKDDANLLPSFEVQGIVGALRGDRDLAHFAIGMYEEGISFDVSVLGMALWALNVFDVVDSGVMLVVHVVAEAVCCDSAGFCL